MTDFHATTPGQAAFSPETPHLLRRLGAGLTALTERAYLGLGQEWASGPHRCSRHGDTDTLIGVSFASGGEFRRRLSGRAVVVLHRTVGGAAIAHLAALRIEVGSASGEGTTVWGFDLEAPAERPVADAWEGAAIDPAEGGIPLPWRHVGQRLVMEAMASMAEHAMRGDRPADLAVAGHGLTAAAKAAKAWLGEDEQ